MDKESTELPEIEGGIRNTSGESKSGGSDSTEGSDCAVGSAITGGADSAGGSASSNEGSASSTEGSSGSTEGSTTSTEGSTTSTEGPVSSEDTGGSDSTEVTEGSVGDDGDESPSWVINVGIGVEGRLTSAKLFPGRFRENGTFKVEGRSTKVVGATDKFSSSGVKMLITGESGMVGV